MIIGIGADHAAIEMKAQIKAHLAAQGHEVVDFGARDAGADPYPVYAQAVGRAVAQGQCALGVLICGTGIGMCISANKMPGIRAAACSEPYSAQLSRRHNDANILCFGARVVGDEVAKMIVDAFLNAEFEGGRHRARVDLIMDIERKR